MGKDMQDSANKVKEGIAEGASNLKHKASDKIEDFKESNMHMNSTRSNMMLWGMAGACAGAGMSLFMMRNASAATKLATIGGMGGAGAYMGNRYSQRSLASRGLKKD